MPLNSSRAFSLQRKSSFVSALPSPTVEATCHLSVESVEPFRVLSPFYYYSAADPLVNGLNVLHVAALIGTVAVLLAVSVVAFERRDLTA